MVDFNGWNIITNKLIKEILCKFDQNMDWFQHGQWKQREITKFTSTKKISVGSYMKNCLSLVNFSMNDLHMDIARLLK
jgi:hypothetical protein